MGNVTKICLLASNYRGHYMNIKKCLSRGEKRAYFAQSVLNDYSGIRYYAQTCLFHCENAHYDCILNSPSIAKLLETLISIGIEFLLEENNSGYTYMYFDKSRWLCTQYQKPLYRRITAAAYNFKISYREEKGVTHTYTHRGRMRQESALLEEHS